jgi:peptidoglycan hydrolase CwlO-like protein
MTVTPTIALIGGLVASVVTPSAIWTGTAYYLNNEYLTVKEYKLTSAESTIQNIQTQIDDLEDAVQFGTCGSQDRCDAMIRKIKRLERDLLEWQTKKNNIQQDRQTA